MTVRICSENNTIESFTQTVCLNRYPNLAFQNRRSTPVVHPRQLHLWRRFLPCTILVDCPDRSRMRNVCQKAFWQRKRNRSKKNTRHLSCKCARADLLNYLEIAMAKSACDLTRCVCLCVCVYVSVCMCMCHGIPVCVYWYDTGLGHRNSNLSKDLRIHVICESIYYSASMHYTWQYARMYNRLIDPSRSMMGNTNCCWQDVADTQQIFWDVLILFCQSLGRYTAHTSSSFKTDHVSKVNSGHRHRHRDGRRHTRRETNISAPTSSVNKKDS